MSNSLLPPNATKFERSLEQVIAHLDDIDVPIGDLWNPWKCPEPLLPWLAWALSVDEWSHNWPEQIKRAVIAASPELHRYKGTVWAVKRALSLLGVDATLTEWFNENGMERGSFNVLALANKNINSNNPILLSEELMIQLTRMIEANKPASRKFNMQLGVRFDQGIGMAAAMNAATVTDINAHATPTPTNAQHSIGLAATLTAATVSDFNINARPCPTNARSGMGAASTIRVANVVNLSANPAPAKAQGISRMGLTATMRAATVQTINVRM